MNRSMRMVFLVSVCLVVGGPFVPQGSYAQEKSQAPLEIGVDKRLNDPTPLETEFLDEDGKPVKLGQYFGEKPVVLAPVYYECPMLCTLVMNGLVKSAQGVSFDVGKDYQVVAFSFDPGETPELAARKKETYVRAYGRENAGQGWHFLTGGEESIRRLTDALGFRYRYDEKTDEFSHPSSVVVLTPEGRISSYFYGIDYPSKDLKLALVEAGKGNVGSFVDQVILFCHRYDPVTGKYGFAVMNFLRIGGLFTILAMASFIFLSLRAEKARRRIRQA